MQYEVKCFTLSMMPYLMASYGSKYRGLEMSFSNFSAAFPVHMDRMRICRNTSVSNQLWRNGVHGQLVAGERTHYLFLGLPHFIAADVNVGGLHLGEARHWLPKHDGPRWKRGSLPLQTITMRQALILASHAVCMLFF